MTTKSEFDQVFEKMNAPDYPATCDQCGAEGTNADIDEHICNESHASRAGERYGFVVFTGRYKILDYYKPNGQQIATADGEEEARLIIQVLNQHATLSEQRERLLNTLKELGLYAAGLEMMLNKHEGDALREARELLATIEQETEVK